MENIDRESYNIISYLREKNGNLLSFDARNQMLAVAQKSQLIVEDFLQKNKLENHLDKYYLLLYCVIFKEELINNNILNILIDNSDNKIDPFLHILMMKRKLNNEIVEKIINKIDNRDDLLNNSQNLGYLPFDYRYHILKRKEISFEIKEKILLTYSDIEYIKDEIYWYLTDELASKGINLYISDIPDEMLENYQDLQDEKRAFEIIANYKEQKIKNMNKF